MSEPLKLNLSAKNYVPKFLRNISGPTPVTNLNPNNTPLNQKAPFTQHTSLKLDSTHKPFIPKNLKSKNLSSTIPQSVLSPQTDVTAPNPQNPPKEKKIEREYFVIDEDDKQYIFDFDYLISFENWEICKESKLLTKEFLKHLEDFNIVESEQIKTNQTAKGGKKRNNYNKKDREKDKKGETDLSSFGRKDISKEVALAEEFKKKIDEEASKDPIRFQITEHLNILTVDNYKNTSENILEIIKDDLEKQEKFLDVLFNKSVNEKAYVKLYAKLCKEFDKKLTQRTEPKTDKNGKLKKPTSIMRVKLLNKCKEIFKMENNEKFDNYIKVQDPIEREIKLKKFVLGNVNFIGELINIQILSKKIIDECLKNLFTRYNKAETDKSLRIVNL